MAWLDRRLVICVSLATSMLTPSASCSAGEVGLTDTEVTIGSCAPLTGQQRIRGTQTVAGGKTYFNYINDKGGIAGRKINLISEDDQYNQQVAIEVFNKKLKDKCFAGSLFMGTAVAAKLIAISDAQKFPMVGFSTGGHFIVDPVHPYAFQIRASYHDEAAEMVNTLWKNGFRRIVIIYQGDAFGTECRDGVLNTMKKLGGTVAGEIAFDRLTHDIEPLLKEAKTFNPDVIIIGGGGDAPVMMCKKLAAEKIPTVVFSSTSDLLVREAGKAADGILITQVFPYVRDELKTVKQYKQLYQKYMHEEPSVSGFEGFMIAMAVCEGLKRAGKDLTRAKFVQALETIHDLDVGLGKEYRLNFSHNQHDGLRGAVTWTTIKDGHIVPFSDWKAVRKK